MKWFSRALFGLCCLMSLQTVFSQQPEDQKGNYVILPGYLGIGSLVSVEIDEGSAFPGSLNAVCSVTRSLIGPEYDVNSLGVSINPECCVVGKTGASVDLNIVVNGSLLGFPENNDNAINKPLSTCGIQMPNSGVYQIAFRSLKNINGTPSIYDRVYVFNFQVIANKSSVIGRPLLVPITEANCKTLARATDARLQIVRGLGGTVLSGVVPLGEDICLEAFYTIDPYNQNMNEGLRVLGCTLVSGTGQSTSVLDANGCADGQLPSIPVNTGFQKVSLESVGSRRTYKARLCFPMFNLRYSEESTLTCQVEYCLNANDDTSPGTCGGAHCDPSAGRKRRSANDTTTSISTPVFLARPEVIKPCSESLGYKVTLGCLASTTVVLLIAIVACLVDTRRVRSMKKTDTVYSDRASTTSSSLYGNNITFRVKW